mmetsp:Transcript_2709/g.10835  ORF Transcript_2709/g.10835 Transcript_2709/m.10835 type:complete len:231 (+) Transcript_2709:628-1320(+)
MAQSGSCKGRRGGRSGGRAVVVVFFVLSRVDGRSRDGGRTPCVHRGSCCGRRRQSCGGLTRTARRRAPRRQRHRQGRAPSRGGRRGPRSARGHGPRPVSARGRQDAAASPGGFACGAAGGGGRGGGAAPGGARGDHGAASVRAGVPGQALGRDGRAPDPGGERRGSGPVEALAVRRVGAGQRGGVHDAWLHRRDGDGGGGGPRRGVPRAYAELPASLAARLGGTAVHDQG